MNEKLPIHNEPERQVFGVKGELVTTNKGLLFVKKHEDTKNVGWVKTPSTEPLQFEKVSLTANTQYDETANDSPTLKFFIPEGNAIIRIDVEMPTGHSFSTGQELVVYIDSNPSIDEPTHKQSYGTSASFSAGPLPSGIHTIKCSARSEQRIPMIVTVTKTGGFGKQFTHAYAYGKISSVDELVLQVYNTNHYSKGKARFIDLTLQIQPLGTNPNYDIDLQTDVINNPSVFEGGGLKAFRGQYLP